MWPLGPVVIMVMVVVVYVETDAFYLHVVGRMVADELELDTVPAGIVRVLCLTDRPRPSWTRAEAPPFVEQAERKGTSGEERGGDDPAIHCFIGHGFAPLAQCVHRPRACGRSP